MSEFAVEDASMTQAWQDVLIRVSQTVLTQRDAASLLAALSDRSIAIVQFDQINLILSDDDAITLLSRDDNGAVSRLNDSMLAAGPVARVQAGQTSVCHDAASWRREHPDLAALTPYAGLGAYCLLPLSTTRQRLGGIEFIRHDEIPFTVPQIAFLTQLAGIVAIAVENLRDRDRSQEQEEQLRQERDYFHILVDVTNTVISKLETRELARELAYAVHRFFGIDFISLDLCLNERKRLQSHSVLFQPGREPLCASREVAWDGSLAGRVAQNGAPLLANRNEMEKLALTYEHVSQLTAQGFQASCSLPLVAGTSVVGALHLAHGSAAPFSRESLMLLQQIAARIAIAIDNALAYEEISRLKDRLASENHYLSEEIRSHSGFGEIVGESDAMAAVMEQVDMVAASDCTVLILGETGTGKELIARAIHQKSARKASTMVKMNCAAIPAGLLESDLFGHERGAYTGAAGQRLGRFELANHGSLFLDEVGDIPLELQPKLLRVLQEREIERLGGNKVIPVDVRVIAATNCDLRQMVAERRYRSDLYYRLNVFPIVVPPLRERQGDIPLLARFLTQKIARRMNRNIEHIPQETLDALARLSWPGNVRELENVIERAVILSRGSTLNLPLAELQQHLEPVSWKSQPTLAPPAVVAPRSAPAPAEPDEERERIIRVLKETNGIVAGPKGAAARLGLKRTTLLSRMQRMGISVKSIADGDGDATAWDAFDSQDS
jgi:formate hydrogenlyase transcriptional activator